jgi:putative N-acetylmannosamine-6-phosphate epimerase
MSQSIPSYCVILDCGPLGNPTWNLEDAVLLACAAEMSGRRALRIEQGANIVLNETELRVAIGDLSVPPAILL